MLHSMNENQTSRIWNISSEGVPIRSRGDFFARGQWAHHIIHVWQKSESVAGDMASEDILGPDSSGLESNTPDDQEETKVTSAGWIGQI